MPTSETEHERANRICLEAIQIARRDGRTRAEYFRIYEREITRLMAEEPASRPSPETPLSVRAR